jgi:hypothetical protein
VSDLKDIFNKFVTDGTLLKIEAYGSGHIHDTFKVETIESVCDDYILQKLNNQVFRNIENLQQNITLVTNHIRSKIQSDTSNDPKRSVLTVIPSKEGDPYYIDSEGSYWRLYIFISDHKSYDIVQSQQHAYEGGKAIGRFQALLSDLPDDMLHETIPFFHDIELRLHSFEEAVRSDRKSRVESSADEVNFVRKRAGEMTIILKLGKEGKIPVRITHNDTKFNNILLDSNDRALCVIDLDTVMPGYIHYDFGDAIRTTATRSAEDEPDLEKVELDLPLFESYSDGYLSEIGNILSDTEVEYLAFAPRLITFTIGLRFLTDHLEGDNYFKIHRPDHNLQRARTQFKLVESNESKYEEMQEIISRLIENNKTNSK